MSGNPPPANLKEYKPASGDPYVSVFGMGNSSPMLTKSQYEGIQSSLAKLRPEDQQLIEAYDNYDSLPNSRKQNAIDPLSRLDDQQRQGFFKRLGDVGLDLGSNTRSVLNDMKPEYEGASKKTKPGAGYNTPVYEVHGQPVRGDMLLKSGHLPEAVSKILDRGGAIGKAALGVGTAAMTFASTGNAAEAGEAAIDATIPYGEAGRELASGNTEAAAKAATVETAENLGSWGGAASGALICGAAGSVVPVLGTATGIAVCGIAGAIGGGELVGSITEKILGKDEDDGQGIQYKGEKLTTAFSQAASPNQPAPEQTLAAAAPEQQIQRQPVAASLSM